MKGFTDVMFILFIAVSVVLAGMFAWNYFADAFNDAANVFVNMSAESFGNTSQTYNATLAIKNSFNLFTNAGDFIIASMFFGLLLLIIVSALLVRFSPLFMPAYVLFTMLATWGALKFKDVFMTIFNENAWMASKFPISSNIMIYLPFIVAVMGGIIIIVQYAFRVE